MSAKAQILPLNYIIHFIPLQSVKYSNKVSFCSRLQPINLEYIIIHLPVITKQFMYMTI